MVADNQPAHCLPPKRTHSPVIPEGDIEPTILEPTPASMGQRPSKRARVEDDEPEDSPFETATYVEEFYPPAGLPCGSHAQHHFENLRASQRAAGHHPWEPFSSTDDWELARWIVTAGLSQRQTNDMLSLNLVSWFINVAQIQ